MLTIWCLVLCASTSGVAASNGNATTAAASKTVNVTAAARNATTVEQALSTVFNLSAIGFVNETQNLAALNSDRYPYRVCMALGTDVVRFARNIECVPRSRKTPHVEGIMLVYKPDIVPYTFPVITYYKSLQFQRSYADYYREWMLGRSVTDVIMPPWEIDRLNLHNFCYSAHVTEIDGITMYAYHQDSVRNDTMMLVEDDYSGGSSQRFVTTKGAYHKGASTWMYTESCTINCVVTVTRARSARPYDYFVLASGEVVDMSPFYNLTNGEPFEEDTARLRLAKNYKMRTHFADPGAPTKTVPLMAFLNKGDATIGWEVKPKHNVTCDWKLWQAVDRAIRTEQNDSYHFVSRSLTATFVTSKENVSYDHSPTLKCVSGGFRDKIDEIYRREYNETHEKDGEHQMYVTNAGLVLVWQGLKSRRLADLEAFARLRNITLRVNATAPPPTPTSAPAAANTTGNSTSGKRRRRSVAVGTPPSADDLSYDVAYAQLQFTYDLLRDYINDALARIMDAWCLDQKRTAEVLRELSKINPSNILSAIYDRPVSARLAGDVVAISSCVDVDQSSVQILKDMRIFENGLVTRCYSRPVVRFKFLNSTQILTGQLGEDHEILLGDARTEVCERNSRKIFVAGDLGYEYRDYRFRNTTDLRHIDVVDTLIRLDINPLENTDFGQLELYSRKEILASNVFNLEDILREYNTQRHYVRYLVSAAQERMPRYLIGLDEFMQGLGAAGKGVGVAFGAVAGAVDTFVSGIAAFFQNPFGALTGVIIAVALVALIYLLYSRQRTAAARPVDYFFPYAAAQASLPQTAAPTVPTAPPAYDDVVRPYRDDPQAPSAYEDRPSATVKKRRRGGVDDEQRSAARGDIIAAGAPPPYSEEDALRMLLALKSLDESRRRAADSATRAPARTPNLLERLRSRGYRRVPVDSDGD